MTLTLCVKFVFLGLRFLDIAYSRLADLKKEAYFVNGLHILAMDKMNNDDHQMLLIT